MTKRVVSESNLKTVCLVAFKEAGITVTDVSLTAISGEGKRANWEIGTLTPQPDIDTAERAFSIMHKVQTEFDVVRLCRNGC